MNINKNKIFFYSFIIIFFFMFTKTNAQYEKVFFDFKINDIDGKEISMSSYKNKAILIVNVASKCGFTKQYSELQKLWSNYKDKGLVVIGIPSNQFGSQEPGNNKEIKKFCETNFNITFPLTEKINVKGDNAHPIYLWAKKNYGISAIPKWNFHKILINKEGKIHDTYSSMTKPLAKKITKEIEKILN